MSMNGKQRAARGVVLLVGAVLAAGLAGCKAKASSGGAGKGKKGPAAVGVSRPAKPAEAAPGHKAVVITDANFKAVTAKGVTLVDLWAPWCSPCRRQGPIVEAVAKLYAGRAVVGKLNVDANPATAKALGVKVIPTLIVFKDGREVKRLVGLSSEAKLKAALDSALGSK